MAHEEKLLSNITALRTVIKTTSDTQQQADDYLKAEHKLINQLLVLQENYPDLKTNKIMQQMMSSLTLLENEAALMRSGFNDAVTYYNTRIQTIPDVFFAKRFGFKPLERLKFEAKAHGVISLNNEFKNNQT